jgi:hypothetical protein
MSSVRRNLGPLTLDVTGLIIGVQILVKGWDKLEAGHHPLLVPFLLFLGALVAVAAFLTLRIEKRTESAHALFHVAEGVAIVLSALALIEGGQLRIPLILLFAGLGYAVLGVVESQPADRRARLVGPLRTSFGCASIVGGIVLAWLAAYGDRSVWAFAVAVVLAGTGGALMLWRRASGPAREHGNGARPNR